MPTTTMDISSSSATKRESTDCSDSLEKLFLENGFRTNDKTSNGCFIKNVTTKLTEIPQLIRDIFPLDKQDETWILSKGFKDKRLNYGRKGNEAEEAEQLANLANIQKQKRKEESEGEDDLNLTGQPLGCSFTLDTNDSLIDNNAKRFGRQRIFRSSNEISYIPLSANEGRTYLSRFNVIAGRVTRQTNVNTSAWVVCNGKDKDGTLFLGSKIFNRDKVTKDGIKATKAISNYKISCTGPYPPNNKHIAFKDVLNLHKSMVGGYHTTRKISSNARATYDLTGTYLANEKEDDELEETSEHEEDLERKFEVNGLSLSLEWSSPRSLLEKPPLTAGSSIRTDKDFNYSKIHQIGSGVAELNAIVIPGDSKLSCYRMYEELEILKGLAGGLDGKGIEWRGTDKNINDEDFLEKRLVAVLEACHHHGPRSGLRVPQELTHNFGENEGGINESGDVRSDVDFTDMIWSAMAGELTSYSELCNSLHLILNTIKQDEIRPFIYPKNTTRFARIVEKIVRDGELMRDYDKSVQEIIPMCLMNYDNSTSRDNSMSREPLEILVEIGIEKLRRDHVHSLLSSSLAGRDDLEPYMQKLSSSKWSPEKQPNFVSAMDCLVRLHLVLETITLCQTFLSSNEECLRSVAQQALKHFRPCDNGEQAIQSKNHIKFYVQMEQIKEKLNKINPSIWQCDLRSEEDHKQETKNIRPDVRTLCHISLEPPSEYALKSSNTKKNESNTSEGSSEENYANEDMEDETNLLRDLQLGGKNASYYYTMASAITRILPGQ